MTTTEKTNDAAAGFTLVELLVVVAIIGTLIGMLLPAVQRARESGRRAACSNSIRQQGVAISNYEAARRMFPPGSDSYTADPATQPARLHAWSSFILPFLEESAVAVKIDYKKVWNAPGGNDIASDAVLPVYVCPSGIERFPGKQDYAGVHGTSVNRSGVERPVEDWEHSGVLYSTDDEAHRLPATAATVA